ncbi:uncharacterized protein CIMG_08739 [Coccidioides immitis RS]|uniref:AAA+ ATPase domain-containing protein n=1 Tax=Coccidioides immitis (strain RS) TaxID=246410 RepID=J3K638_COCIM|nr:uncharacterized protein CIMG_08739 [Coccidioides immitis RS]EAS29993.3 hypothetical protein CIMG_08739 [Coccidioides immitis RS]
MSGALKPNGKAPALPTSPAPIPTPAFTEPRDPLTEALAASASTTGPTEAKEDKSQKQKIRGSKMEYKTVNEIWNKKKHDYEVVEDFGASSDSNDKYDEYLFVNRRRHDPETRDFKTYLDFKSPELVNVLRHVLLNVNAVSLREDKPSVSPNILFRFLPELEDYYKDLDPQSVACEHLYLLLDFLNKHFAPLKDRLNPLVDHQEITFELLWALFKPNELIFMIDPYAEQPRCFVYDSGEVINTPRGICFEIECRSLDYDGRAFGETTAVLHISKFRSARKISELGVFPLQYHNSKDKIKSELVGRGRKFVNLMGVTYCEYNGLAHIKTKKSSIKFQVTGRIMVDPSAFKEKNPNYGISRVKEKSTVNVFLFSDNAYEKEKDQKTVKPRNFDTENMTDREYILCSPTVLGFSLNKKTWAEFAVSGIQPINGNKLSAFDHLEIPEIKKNMIQTMVESHKPGSEQSFFDDIIVGKGRGLVFLLYGPPGAGKTLTAESTADFLGRPLYTTCAGDFGIQAENLEEHLSRVLDLVRRWNAILLLDEADVFLSDRSLNGLHHNALVSIFLRSLEYFEGIMFLTTNRHTTLDPAMQSRIHVGIKYEPLSREAKTRVWRKQLENAGAMISEKELELLLGKSSNGRQIKNIARAAFALAKGGTVGFEHIKVALTCADEFERDFLGPGAVDNMTSYT